MPVSIEKRGLVDAACAVVMIDVICVVQAGDLNAGFAGAGVDEITVAQVDTNVGDTLGISIFEEHEVAGLQVSLINIHTVGVLRGRTMGDGVAEALGDVVNQTGAVKTGAGRRGGRSSERQFYVLERSK